jgi:hypothetical protein
MSIIIISVSINQSMKQLPHSHSLKHSGAEILWLHIHKQLMNMTTNRDSINV